MSEDYATEVLKIQIQREDLERFLRAEVYDLFSRLDTYTPEDFAKFKEALRALFYGFWESREGGAGEA